MMQKMKAAIFDMDGTLLDSMDEWRKLNVSLVREMGIALTDEQEKDLYSMSGMMVVEYIKEHFDVDVPFPVLLQRSRNLMEQPYRGGIPLKPGARDYLRRLGERGVKRVLCTATSPHLALVALNTADMVKDLDYVFSVDTIGGSKSKKDPAFFDRMCAFIGEKKEDCVMFEDALYAMKGARAAGLGVVGITDMTNERDRAAIEQVCDVVIDSYDELE